MSTSKLIPIKEIMDVEDPSISLPPPKTETSDFEACRICLSTDVKMHNLQGTHLGHCMDSITGDNQSCEGLLNYVCYQCAPSLIKCYKLIEKCRRAQTTLEDILKKNGKITKMLIEEQKRSDLNLQSPLDSYLLINYFHIKYDNDYNTSHFITTESDPNERINIKLKNELKEEPSDVETELLKALIDSKTFEKGESKMKKEGDSDTDVESVDINDPVIQISSDEEKSEDFISLKPYEVKLGKRGKELISSKYIHDKPIYNSHKANPIAKKGKKKKYKGKRKIPTLSDLSGDRLLYKFFDIKKIPVQKTPNMKFSCKLCQKVFTNKDDAKDHQVLGCERNSTSTSRDIAPPINQPLFWEDWTGNK